MEFPEDLLRYILLRLPVISLLRFRSVSTNWCALIDNNDFIKQHINYSTKTLTNHSIILHQYELLSTHIIGLYSPILQPITINHNHRVTKLIGSCRGLLLLCLSVYEQDSSNATVIWNPFTRKQVKLPVITLKNPFTNHIPENLDTVYGFGYDLVSDDYRVLMLVQFFAPEDDDDLFRDILSRVEAYVYSLRSKSWKKVQDFPNYRMCAYQIRATLACGALHWFIIMGSELEIEIDIRVASFDLATEECKIFIKPDYDDKVALTVILWEFDGCLSIVINYFRLEKVHVYVMKDYGVAESWTKLFVVGSEVIRSPEQAIPLVYSESGDEVLMIVNMEKLLWYNLEKKTVKLVDVSGISRRFYPMICLETLFSLGEIAENDVNQGG